MCKYWVSFLTDLSGLGRPLTAVKSNISVVFIALISFLCLQSTTAFAQQATPDSQVGDMVTNPETNETVTVTGTIEDSNGLVVGVLVTGGSSIFTVTEVGATFFDMTGSERIITSVTDDPTSMLPVSITSRLVSDEADPPETNMAFDIVQMTVNTEMGGGIDNTGSEEFVPPPIGNAGIIDFVRIGSTGSDGRNGGGTEICIPYTDACTFIGVQSTAGEDGGDGPTVNQTISNRPDTITSTSNDTAAITVGSIGGNGGDGGSEFGIVVEGSAGGDAGAGGQVTVTNNADVNVSGTNSEGLFVFSQSGTAGEGGTGGGIVASGGNGGMPSSGGDVNATNNGSLTTQGDGGHGFRVFSTGGSAGSAGSGFGLVGAGGNGSPGGDGGNVSATNGQQGDIQTQGDSANGILAQSIGGTGGDSGAGGGIVGVAGSSEFGGDGGQVNVTNQGSITTVSYTHLTLPTIYSV